MKTIENRQKSYAGTKKKNLQFIVGDKVYQKVSPTKWAIRFGSVGKLKRRYIGPFDIIAKVCNLAYELVLPSNLDGVHNVFYVFILKKFVMDESHIIPNYMEFDTQSNATEEKPLKILEWLDKISRAKTVPLVKLLWSNWGVEEASWEKKSICEKSILNCLKNNLM